MRYIVVMVVGLLSLTQVVMADDDDMIPTIEVSASASVSREPDLAVVRLSVETFSKTALEATQQNAEKMSRLNKALKKMRIDALHIRTTNFQVDPQYDYKDGRQRDPRPIGYRVHNTVEVEIVDIKQVGKVIDGAINAGANRVMGLVFQVKDSEKAYQMALSMAMKRAKEQAQAIAMGGDVKLGDLIWVSTSGRMPAPVYKTMRAESMMASDTSISSGELDISANVNVKYRIMP